MGAHCTVSRDRTCHLPQNCMQKTAFTCRRLRNSGESPYGELVSCINCCWFCCAIATAVASTPCWPVTRPPPIPLRPPIPVWVPPTVPPKPKSTSSRPRTASKLQKQQIRYVQFYTEMYNSTWLHCIWTVYCIRLTRVKFVSLKFASITA